MRRIGIFVLAYDVSTRSFTQCIMINGMFLRLCFYALFSCIWWRVCYLGTYTRCLYMGVVFRSVVACAWSFTFASLFLPSLLLLACLSFLSLSFCSSDFLPLCLFSIKRGKVWSLCLRCGDLRRALLTFNGTDGIGGAAGNLCADLACTCFHPPSSLAFACSLHSDLSLSIFICVLWWWMRVGGIHLSISSYALIPAILTN